MTTEARGGCAGASAERALLEERREALLALFDDARDPAMLLDASGTIVAVTAPLAGIEPKELVGASLSSRVPAEHRDAVDQALRDALGPSGAHGVELSIVSPPGEPHWYLAAVSPVRAADARVIGVLLVTTEITARKLEEERLRRSERLMVDTEGVAHLGTWEWDPREPNATWSSELYRIYGLDPAAHTPSYPDYLERVHPDDRARVAEATERVFKDHKSYSHDERVFRPNGELRYLHTWAQAMTDAQGQLVRLLGVCQDITDRKHAEAALAESEARFRAIFEHSGVGMATLDADGRVLESNAALARMLGSSKEKLRRQRLRDWLAGAGGARAGSAVSELMRGLRDGYREEARVRAPVTGDAADERSDAVTDDGAGSGLCVNVTMTAVRAGDQPFVVAILEDLSARKDADAKAQLLSVTSHELRNPLTPILLQLEMLRGGRLGALTPAQLDAVTLVHGQAERLTELVKDLQDMARIEQRRLELRREEIDVSRVLVRVGDAFRGLAEQRGVQLETVASEPLPALADPDRLQQVLFNLLSNAFKFTPRGGSVRMAAAADRGGVHVRVEDTGPGLNEAQVARLFQAFSQVHERRDDIEAGTGLGLFISKHLVEMHGGRMWVESAVGHGATFHFTLGAPS